MGDQSTNDINGDFIRLNALRKKEGKETIDNIIRSNVVFTKKDFGLKNSNELFGSFNKAFLVLGIVDYIPFFNIMMEDCFDILRKDNVQAIEFRTFFRNLFNDKGKLSIDEEYEFYSKFINQKE